MMLVEKEGESEIPVYTEAEGLETIGLEKPGKIVEVDEIRGNRLGYDKYEDKIAVEVNVGGKIKTRYEEINRFHWVDRENIVPAPGDTLGFLYGREGKAMLSLLIEPEGTEGFRVPVMTQGKVLESRDGWVRLETAAGTGWIRQENFIEVSFRPSVP